MGSHRVRSVGSSGDQESGCLGVGLGTLCVCNQTAVIPVGRVVPALLLWALVVRRSDPAKRSWPPGGGHPPSGCLCCVLCGVWMEPAGLFADVQVREAARKRM